MRLAYGAFATDPCSRRRQASRHALITHADFLRGTACANARSMVSCNTPMEHPPASAAAPAADSPAALRHQSSTVFSHATPADDAARRRPPHCSTQAVMRLFRGANLP